MGFQLPEDSPLQQAQNIAEGLASLAGTYHSTLIRAGIDADLAGELTLQYAEQIFRVMYSLDARAVPPPNNS